MSRPARLWTCSGRVEYRAVGQSEGSAAFVAAAKRVACRPSKTLPCAREIVAVLAPEVEVAASHDEHAIGRGRGMSHEAAASEARCVAVCPPTCALVPGRMVGPVGLGLTRYRLGVVTHTSQGYLMSRYQKGLRHPSRRVEGRKTLSAGHR